MDGAADPRDVIYLDNNATTSVAPEVVEELLPYLERDYFNPSSMYEPAGSPAEALKRARRRIGTFLGAQAPDEVIFTSCATESCNAALRGALHASPDRRHIITTAVEHPAVLELCKDLERREAEVTYLPVDASGRLDPRDLIKAIRPDTLMVAIMHANNETGVIFPVANLARIVKETDPKILFFSDATQSAGKLGIDLSGELSHVDMLAFSGHKLHAPKGVGVLWVRRGTPWRPLMVGGHQESGRRAGTENVPYVVGLARAVGLAEEAHDRDVRKIGALRDELEQGLSAKISYLEINGRGAERLPNTLNVAVHFVEGEAMLYQLSEHGICASSGSACTSGSLDPSHVLKAMGVPFTAVHGSIRFSLSRYNTEQEIQKVLDVFPDVVESLRRLSPYWDAAQGRPRPEAESMMQRAATPGAAS
jgi:cysteine desulfurase